MIKIWVLGNSIDAIPMALNKHTSRHWRGYFKKQLNDKWSICWRNATRSSVMVSRHLTFHTCSAVTWSLFLRVHTGLLHQGVCIIHVCVCNSQDLSTLQCDVCILVFSVTDRRSFHRTAQLRLLLRESQPQTPIILVGNKSDLVRSREISSEGR